MNCNRIYDTMLYFDIEQPGGNTSDHFMPLVYAQALPHNMEPEQIVVIHHTALCQQYGIHLRLQTPFPKTHFRIQRIL